MWATLALMSALTFTPAQAGQLELKNVRVTNGLLGQKRDGTTYLPGDMVVLAFDIEGLQTAADGQVQYSMGMELTDKAGKKLYGKEPRQSVAVNSLGTSRLPSFALTEIGTDTEPGEYTMTVTVKDMKGGGSVKKEQKFDVKKTELGIVRPGFVYTSLSEDEAGMGTMLAPPVAVPGQNLMVHFALVGFELKGNKPNPNVAVTMEVQDESGKPVLGKPFTGKVSEIDEEGRKLRVIPFHVPISVNRSGKFKVVLTAKDNHSGKTATLPLDLKVVDVE